MTEAEINFLMGYARQVPPPCCANKKAKKALESKLKIAAEFFKIWLPQIPGNF